MLTLITKQAYVQQKLKIPVRNLIQQNAFHYSILTVLKQLIFAIIKSLNSISFIHMKFIYPLITKTDVQTHLDIFIYLRNFFKIVLPSLLKGMLAEVFSDVGNTETFPFNDQDFVFHPET